MKAHLGKTMKAGGRGVYILANYSYLWAVFLVAHTEMKPKPGPNIIMPGTESDEPCHSGTILSTSQAMD